MPFSVKKIKGIDTSDLEKLGASVVDLAKYTEDEFSQVASALQGNDPEPIWNRAPPKPRRGTTFYADGTNWNPGQGQGPYWFDGTTYHPMGQNAITDAPSDGNLYGRLNGAWSAAPGLKVWTPYTPSISANSGTFTTASASGRFNQIGKTVFVQIVVTITINGTAAGFITASLPVTAISSYILNGRENNITGKLLQGITAISGGNAVAILTYDNLYPGGNGFQLILSGIYEAV